MVLILTLLSWAVLVTKYYSAALSLVVLVKREKEATDCVISCFIQVDSAPCPD